MIFIYLLYIICLIIIIWFFVLVASRIITEFIDKGVIDELLQLLHYHGKS